MHVGASFLTYDVGGSVLGRFGIKACRSFSLRFDMEGFASFADRNGLFLPYNFFLIIGSSVNCLDVAFLDEG